MTRKATNVPAKPSNRAQIERDDCGPNPKPKPPIPICLPNLCETDQTHCSLSADQIPKSLAASNRRDRKSTRLNSSHLVISYAVFCLKKKKKIRQQDANERWYKDTSLCDQWSLVMAGGVEQAVTLRHLLYCGAPTYVVHVPTADLIQV